MDEICEKTDTFFSVSFCRPTFVIFQPTLLCCYQHRITSHHIIVIVWKFFNTKYVQKERRAPRQRQVKLSNLNDTIKAAENECNDLKLKHDDVFFLLSAKIPKISASLLNRIVIGFVAVVVVLGEQKKSKR